MDTVDIVLTTYNGEAYLAEQLESLLAQTYADLRIFIFDDGSTDGTEMIVSDYADRYENIFFRKNKKNLGYTRNFLYGVRRTSAAYVMLCDQDDIWYPDKVEKTLAAMKRAERGFGRPVLVFTDAELYDGRMPEKRSFHESTHLNPKKVDFSSLLMENKCIGCTVMVNRALLDYLDRLPTGIRVHDWWLALIASAFGRVVYLDEMTLRYRQHAENQIGGAGFTDYLRDRLGSLGRQRAQIRATYRQGRAFYLHYREILPERERRVAGAFASMEQAPWLDRRLRMIRFGFTKSGFVRNVGLFLLM